MACNVVWSAEADIGFKAIIFYLKKEWSDLVADEFTKRVMRRPYSPLPIPHLLLSRYICPHK